MLLVLSILPPKASVLFSPLSCCLIQSHNDMPFIYFSSAKKGETTFYSQGKDCNHYNIRYLFGLECRILNARREK